MVPKKTMGEVVKDLRTKPTVTQKVLLPPELAAALAHKGERVTIPHSWTGCPNTLMTHQTAVRFKCSLTDLTLKRVEGRRLQRLRWGSTSGRGRGAPMNCITICTAKPPVTAVTMHCLHTAAQREAYAPPNTWRSHCRENCG